MTGDFRFSQTNNNKEERKISGIIYVILWVCMVFVCMRMYKCACVGKYIEHSLCSNGSALRPHIEFHHTFTSSTTKNWKLYAKYLASNGKWPTHSHTLTQLCCCNVKINLTVPVIKFKSNESYQKRLTIKKLEASSSLKVKSV